MFSFIISSPTTAGYLVEFQGLLECTHLVLCMSFLLVCATFFRELCPFSLWSQYPPSFTLFPSSSPIFTVLIAVLHVYYSSSYWGFSNNHKQECLLLIILVDFDSFPETSIGSRCPYYPETKHSIFSLLQGGNLSLDRFSDLVKVSHIICNKNPILELKCLDSQFNVLFIIFYCM